MKETIAITERIDFSLDELRYEYPHELVPVGETSTSHLRSLTEQGMRWRWPEGTPDKVVKLIEHELELITELHYESLFPYRSRYRPVRPRQRHSLSGTRLRGQFSRLFLPGDYRSGSRSHGNAHGAVYFKGAKRAA